MRANALARAYTGLDFAAGTGDFTMELKAMNGYIEGYAEPVFKDLQMFSWKKDVQEEKKGPIKLLYEAAAQGVVSMLKSPSKDQLVTKVPLTGVSARGKSTSLKLFRCATRCIFSGVQIAARSSVACTERCGTLIRCAGIVARQVDRAV